MRLLFSFCLLFIFIGTSFGQNPDGFDKMAKNMAGKKAPIITMDAVLADQKAGKEIVFLDSRELGEFQVSHMNGAIWVGFDNIDWTKIDKIKKTATIIIYCSVGYRSGKLTEQLAKKGYTKVVNLYGGLFNWANNGGKIVNSRGVATNEIHGYNKNWSKWVNEDKCQIIL
jgi:rhodanese-related sulfurtransferase